MKTLIAFFFAFSIAIQACGTPPIEIDHDASTDANTDAPIMMRLTPDSSDARTATDTQTDASADVLTDSPDARPFCSGCWQDDNCVASTIDHCGTQTTCESCAGINEDMCSTPDCNGSCHAVITRNDAGEPLTDCTNRTGMAGHCRFLLHRMFCDTDCGGSGQPCCPYGCYIPNQVGCPLNGVCP